MKFVIGLLAGASATLLIATLAGLDWEPPTRLDENLLAQTSLAPAQEAQKTPEPMSDLIAKRSEPGQVSLEAEEEPAPFRSVTIDPLPAEPPPEPAPAVVAAAPELAKTSGAAAKAAMPPGILAGPESAVADKVSGVTAAPQAQALANAEAVTTAVVWKPFHSEVSATGFARRLSTQLGYPFRALREGPAKYHVVFDYETPQQRELLRQQVQALTGFSVI